MPHVFDPNDLTPISGRGYVTRFTIGLSALMNRKLWLSDWVSRSLPKGSCLCDAA